MTNVQPNFHGMNFRAFFQAYVEAALWTEEERLAEETKPDDQGTLSAEVTAQMERDCQAFYVAHLDLIDDDLSQAGHDFWLTRNGHGAGFWDGDWPKAAGDALTAASKAFGGFDLYIGDDGFVYGSKA